MSGSLVVPPLPPLVNDGGIDYVRGKAMKLFSAVLCVVALALSLGASGRAETHSFTDPAGDAQGGLDVTEATVANDPATDTFTITVTLNNSPVLVPQEQLSVWIDADRSTASGDPGFAGADYQLFLQSNGYTYRKWDPGQNAWVNVTEDPNFSVTYRSGMLTWTFASQQIGSSHAFNFLASTYVTNPNDAASPFVDYAPDAPPLYSYAPAAPRPTVASTAPTVSGSGRAGTTYTVRSLAVDLSNGSTTNATNLECTATLGGVRFRGSGQGGCAFKLPKHAKGKRLVVRITGTVGTTNVAATETLRVR
jgi:hypothetical protein